MKSVANQPYLGVELQDNLKRDTHINNTVIKGNQALDFICRNLYMCPQKVKETYFTMVRPHLKYACAAWDPHLEKDIYRLEMVQRKVA